MAERGQEERIEGWWKGSVQAATQQNAIETTEIRFSVLKAQMSKIRVPT